MVIVYCSLPGNKQLVELLVTKMKPEQINQLNHLSQTCLHEAAAENRTELIQILIKAGARTGTPVVFCFVLNEVYKLYSRCHLYYTLHLCCTPLYPQNGKKEVINDAKTVEMISGTSLKIFFSYTYNILLRIWLLHTSNLAIIWPSLCQIVHQ